MNYSPSDILRKFVMRQCIQQLVETSEHPIWLNLTFWENVTNKAYAVRRWNHLQTNLRRHYPGIRIVGIWARQRRGAWHIHAVVDRRVDITWFRRKAMHAGFGPQCFLKELDGHEATPEKIARYITGYCTDKNGLDPVKDKGVRRTIFVGEGVKVVNMRYRSGLKRVTALGREISETIAADEQKDMTKFERDFSGPFMGKRIWETWGEWYKRNREYWFAVGWEALSGEERDEMLEMDQFINRYFDTGRWSYV